ncbi:MAG: hypothetical protein ACTIJH_05950 [Moraxellaceae bacterium]
MYTPNIKALGAICLAGLLSSCGVGADKDDTKLHMGEVGFDAPKSSIGFSDGVIAGSDIAIHGQYDQDLFGEVQLSTGRKVILLDDDDAEYYAAGLGTPKTTNGLFVDSDKVIEVQSLDIVHFIQDALLEQGFSSKAIDHYKVKGSSNSVTKTIIDISLDQPVSTSLIRNLILVRLNNNTTPKSLPLNDSNAMDQVRLEVAYWKNEKKGDVYMWISVFRANKESVVRGKYADVIDGDALGSLRFSL